MTWAELYSEAARPTLEEIDAYAHTPLWPQLRAYLAAAYGAGPVSYTHLTLPTILLV